MIARLELVLDLKNKDYDYNISSILHGIIMEKIPSEYAEFLHQEQIIPFSINISNYNENLLWTINTLNEEAYQKIIKNLEQIREIFIKQKGIRVKVTKLNVSKITYEELINKTYFNFNNISNKCTLYIRTPLSFKRNKTYLIFPDLELFFRSIMIRFDSFSKSEKIYDKETLLYLENNIKIVKYKIKTNVFHLHKCHVPGFLGSITFLIPDSIAIKKLISLLLAYSEYSGIGIKTALGMGSVSLIKPQPPIYNIGIFDNK